MKGTRIVYALAEFSQRLRRVTKIKFSIPVGTGHAPSLLRIYDMLGREFATLVNENLQPGSYEMTLDATGLASGVYFYRLSVGRGFVQTKRLLLLR